MAHIGNVGQPVDYTRMRLSKRQRIKVCPRCGRKGQVTRYPNGDVRVSHYGYIALGMMSITDHCYIKHGE
jgi:hypothetical protein